MAKRQGELQSSCMVLPVGFRFIPTDEELVEHYLVPRVLQQPLPAGIVVDFDIYKSDPWDLPRHQFRYTNQQQQRELYFFTPRHAVASKTNGGLKNRIGGTSEARCRRTAGCGVWHANGRDTIIMNNDDKDIAHTMTFNFEKIENGKKDRTKTEWIMHEYRLPPSFPKFEDLVLCKIYEKKSKAQEETEKLQLKRRRNEEPLPETITDSVSFPPGEQEEATKSEERMATRTHAVENQLIADNNGIHAYRMHSTESTSQYMASLWYSSSQPNPVPCEEPEAEKRIHKRMRVEDIGWDNDIETYGGVEEVEDVEETVAAKQAKEHEQKQGLMTDKIESRSDEVDITCVVAAVNEEVAVEERIVQRLAEEPEQQQCLVTDKINDRWILHIPNSIEHKRMRVKNNGLTTDNNAIETCGGGEEVEDVEETVAVKHAEEHEQQEGLMTDKIESRSYEVDSTCVDVGVKEEVAVEERIVQRQAEEPEQQQQCLPTDIINDRWIYGPNDWVSFPPPVANYDTTSIWDEDLRRSLQPFETSHWQFDYSEIPDID